MFVSKTFNATKHCAGCVFPKEASTVHIANIREILLVADPGTVSTAPLPKIWPNHHVYHTDFDRSACHNLKNWPFVFASDQREISSSAQTISTYYCCVIPTRRRSSVIIQQRVWRRRNNRTITTLFIDSTTLYLLSTNTTPPCLRWSGRGEPPGIAHHTRGSARVKN